MPVKAPSLRKTKLYGVREAERDRESEREWERRNVLVWSADVPSLFPFSPSSDPFSIRGSRLADYSSNGHAKEQEAARLE